MVGIKQCMEIASLKMLNLHGSAIDGKFNEVHVFFVFLCASRRNQPGTFD